MRIIIYINHFRNCIEPSNSAREAIGTKATFVNIEDWLSIQPDYLPRRIKFMHKNKNPPAIDSYFTLFLPTTRRLLLSGKELAREVQDGTSLLGRFISKVYRNNVMVDVLGPDCDSDNWYQVQKHYWGQVIRCDFDWDKHTTDCLERLFENVASPPSAEARLESPVVNRHARRKIGAWLNSGWCVP